MAKLESLVVDLQLETAQLRAGIDRATSQLGRFGAVFSGLSKIVSAGFAVAVGKQAVGALANFVQAGSQAADRMGKLAQITGTTSEGFSRLEWAARLSDVSTEDLGSALTKLNRSMSEAHSGSREQVALFKSLGVSITDAGGKLRGTEDVFKVLATKFATLKNDGDKARLMMEAFGKSGAQLIPLMNGGAEALRKAAAEADKFGFTVGGGGARGAEEFNDSMTRLSLVLEGLGRKVATDVAPALTQLSTALFNSEEGARLLSDVGKGLAFAIKAIATAALDAWKYLRDMLDMLSFLGDVATAENMFTGFGDALAKLEEKLNARMVGFQKLKDAMWKDPAKEAKDSAKEQTESAGKIVESMSRMEAQRQAATKAAAERLRIAKEDASIREKMAQLDQELGVAQRAVGADASRRRTDYARAGLSETGKLQARTAGFGSFEDALTQGSALLRDYNEKMSDIKAIQTSLPGADQSKALEEAERIKEMSDRAYDAADAFRELREKGQDAADKLEQLGTKAVTRARNRLLEASGVGDLVEAGTTGASIGGPWGAVIAVVAELLVKSEGFGQLVQIVMAVVQELANAIGQIVIPLQPLLAALMLVARALGTALGPAFKLLGAIVQPFVPIVLVLGKIIQSLAPVIGIVAQAFLFMQAPLLFLSVQVLPIVFDVLRIAGIGILHAVKFFGGIWNGIINALTSVLDALAAWTIDLGPLGKIKPFAALQGMSDAAKSTQFEMAGLDEQIRDLSELTYDSAIKEADAIKDSIVSRNKEKDAIDRVVEALTNVPKGVKVALNRFNSADTFTSAKGLAASFEAAGTGSVVLNVYGDVNGVDDVADKVEEAIEKKNLRNQGTRFSWKGAD